MRARYVGLARLHPSLGMLRNPTLPACGIRHSEQCLEVPDAPLGAQGATEGRIAALDRQALELDATTPVATSRPRAEPSGGATVERAPCAAPVAGRIEPRRPA
jgi:hypothetical protein